MRAVVLGGKTVFLCFVAAAAVVLICGLLEAAGANQGTKTELLATSAGEGKWQDLAVWHGKTEEDSDEPDTSIAWHKPKWLEQAGRIARGDAEPFGHEKQKAENEEGGRFGHEDGELEETRELRGRLSAAERELEAGSSVKAAHRGAGGGGGEASAGLSNPFDQAEAGLPGERRITSSGRAGGGRAIERAASQRRRSTRPPTRLQ